MDIQWITALIDQPAEVFDRGTRFWQQVTCSDVTDFHGDDDPCATFIPGDGDPHLKVQRVGRRSDAPAVASIHLDLHVSSLREARVEAETAGASVIADPDHIVMHSPAGLTFCLVDHVGGPTRIRPVALTDGGHPHLVDQVSIDVPASQFDEECAFWSHITGWPLHTGALAEFAFLKRPPAMPLRLLLQRLGTSDGATEARAHLDIACGPHVDALAAEHQALGAELIGQWHYWTTMKDPAGGLYCLTRRDPETGSL